MNVRPQSIMVDHGSLNANLHSTVFPYNFRMQPAYVTVRTRIVNYCVQLERNCRLLNHVLKTYDNVGKIIPYFVLAILFVHCSSQICHMVNQGIQLVYVFMVL